MTNAETRLGPRRPGPGAKAARRAPQESGERDNFATTIDRLIEVANKLKEARTLGEACSDGALIYFIDVAIAHVCDSLGAARQPESAEASSERPHPSF